MNSPELQAILRAKVQAKRKYIELLTRLGGVSRYRPHPAQDAFHRAAGAFRRRMVRGGNRSGKSTLGCAEDCAWLLRERPWYKRDDPARLAGIPQRPLKGLVITQDWDLVDAVFTSQRGSEGKIFKMLPRDGFIKSTKRNHSGVIDTIETSNGSLLKFDTVQSWKTNPKGIESVDWDFIHIDEPCPQGMWIGASRGLMDRHGSAWFTLTPLSEFWINDYFFPEETGGSNRADVWSTTMSTYDNPNLSREAIAEFEATLSEDEVECRIKGLPLHLAGLVYKEFDWSKHVLQTIPEGWNDYSTPPQPWPVYLAVDPHPRTPHAVLFCAVDPFGTRYYYRDIFQKGTVETLCPTMKSALKNRFFVRGKLDPLGFIVDQTTGRSMESRFADCGFSLEKAVKDPTNGILKVRQGLREGSILFSPDAIRTLWEIQRFCWQDDKEKPVDKDDHMMENLYRLELDEPTWIDRSGRWNFPVNDIEITSPGFDRDEPLSFAL